MREIALASVLTSMLVTITGTGSGFAQQANCSDALKQPDVTKRATIAMSDIVLARSVSENTYKQEKQNASGDAVIYGIPMGASWSDYQENIRAFSESLKFEEHDKYLSFFESSRLSGDALAAYRFCLTRKDTVALVGEAGTDGYSVWFTYTPSTSPPPASLQGEVIKSQSTNWTQETLDSVAKQISEVAFAGRRVDHQYNLIPANKSTESVLVVKVGNDQRVLRVPPLSVPTVKIEVAELGRVSASTRQNDMQHVYGMPSCISSDSNERGQRPPELKDARFLPSTARVIVAYMNDKPGTKVEIAKGADRFRICMNYELHNTSGKWNSALTAAISVERLVKDVDDVPIVTALSPIKLLKQ
jgi:hypothetical protein